MTEHWRTIQQGLTRPYPVSLPMVVLILLVPCYLFIARAVEGGTLSAPAMTWDNALPLLPAWALVYGALYLYLIILPVFIIRDPEHIRRTFWAYVLVWVTAYIVFLFYPTAAPRPASVVGEGFAVWGLRSLYAADPPFNCFPSLHVAHASLSALTAFRLHRGVGVAAMAGALLVALSTLFTKQHYIADVLAGMAFAGLAYLLVLRRTPSAPIPEIDRRSAPLLALAVGTVVGVVYAVAWAAYGLGVEL